MFAVYKLSSFHLIWKFENESLVPLKQFRINTLVTFE